MSPSEFGVGSQRSNGRWSFNTSAADHSTAAVVVDEAPIAKWLGHAVAPVVADLIEVVAAVQYVDRLERRPPATSSGDSWVRSLDLTIGVRQLELWQDEKISGLLQHLLLWLTDDLWDFSFVPPTDTTRPSESLLALFRPLVDGDAIALYSGGLDSFAGLALDIMDGIKPILISAVSNTRQASCQADTVHDLQRHFNISLSRIPIDFHLRKVEAKESSHRSRGFGFLALASCLATSAQMEEIRVYENGIGSINLPYSRSQIGAQATRTMHPESLQRAESLFSAILDFPISIVNPRQYQTKGQMCQLLPDVLYLALPKALSCDTSFSHRATNIPNYGTCTSCLLRHQALWGADMGSLDQLTQYRANVLFPEDGKEQIPYNLRAMLSQAARLNSALRESNPWEALLGEFPELVYAKMHYLAGVHKT